MRTASPSTAALLVALASLSLAEAASEQSARAEKERSGRNGRRRLRRTNESAGKPAQEAASTSGNSIDRSRNGRRRLRRTNESAGKPAQEAASTSGNSIDRRMAKLPREQRRQRRRQPPPQSARSAATNAAPGCGPTPGTHRSPYLGCYADRAAARAFPFELHANLSRERRLGHGALDCERECSARGYRFVGREFRGQCFCGNKWSEIARYGKAVGCDCCGNNVGANRMCVWENADHPDSQAEPPQLPVLTPAQVRPVSQPAGPPTHAHLTTTSSWSNSHGASFGNSYGSSNHQHQMATTNGSVQAQNKNPAHVATHKPLGTFRLRLHWQPNFRWQGSAKERFWCMECRGGCRLNNSLQISHCGEEARQKFIAIQKTLRPATNPSLCATVTGYGGTDDPLKLRRCNRSPAQNFDEVRAAGKFELQPANNYGRCISQHHHPKDKEALFPEKCEKTRKFDTTHWVAF
ncbi:hypothetical protein ACHAXT_006489 [Thalassiosira profunda]